MTISSQIIEVLDHLCTKFGIAIDWSQQNIMPYLQELAGKYISYEAATSIAWIVVFAVLAIIGIVIWVLDVQFGYDSFGVMFGCLLIIGAFIGLVFQIEDVLACKYFPEKQIVEYVKTLMQNQ